jgi:hypothetical protein
MGEFNLYNFIFSEKFSTKFFRHISFWLLWLGVYSTMQAIRRIQFMHFPPLKAIWFSTLEMAVQMPIDMLFVYWIIYFLIPRYLLKSKLLSFFFYWLLAVVFISFFNYYYVHLFVLPMRGYLGIPVPQQPGLVLTVMSILLNFNFEAGFATSIRLIKIVFYQQKQNDTFHSNYKKRTKRSDSVFTGSDAEFLSSLVNEVTKLMMQPQRASDRQASKALLEFLLLQHSSSEIIVQKELESLENYLEIQSALHNCSYSLKVNPSDEASELKITPFTFIPTLSPFLQCHSDSEKKPMHFDILFSIEKQLAILNIKVSEENFLITDYQNTNHFNLIKKLNLNYPQAFTISKTIQETFLQLVLKIELNKVVPAYT